MFGSTKRTIPYRKFLFKIFCQFHCEKTIKLFKIKWALFVKPQARSFLPGGITILGSRFWKSGPLPKVMIFLCSTTFTFKEKGFEYHFCPRTTVTIGMVYFTVMWSVKCCTVWENFHLLSRDPHFSTTNVIIFFISNRFGQIILMEKFSMGCVGLI